MATISSTQNKWGITQAELRCSPWRWCQHVHAAETHTFQAKTLEHGTVLDQFAFRDPLAWFDREQRTIGLRVNHECGAIWPALGQETLEDRQVGRLLACLDVCVICWLDDRKIDIWYGPERSLQERRIS